MIIKIITPEYVVFEGSVESILLPGKQGEFQIFKNHAAIVSALVGGNITIFTNDFPAQYSKHFSKATNSETTFTFPIKSGVLEFSNDQGIILCE